MTRATRRASGAAPAAFAAALAVAVAAAAIAVATAGASRPPTPPPTVSGTRSAPPPAWVRAGQRWRWLAYSSYCWTRGGAAACVDFVPPQSRRDLPVLRVRRGTELTFRLGFRPTALELALVGARPQRTWKLRAAATSSWRAVRGGVLVLSAEAAPGSAGYAFRLRLG